MGLIRADGEAGGSAIIQVVVTQIELILYMHTLKRRLPKTCLFLLGVNKKWISHDILEI